MFKKAFWFHFRLAAIRFIIFGVVGWSVEIFVQSIFGLTDDIIHGNFTKQSLEMFGQTGFWGFFVYGLVSIPYSLFFYRLKEAIPNKFLGVPLLGLFLRLSIYVALFYAIEFLTGFFAKYILGIRLWYDYSDKPLNVLGLIDFSMTPIWYFGAYFGESLTSRLLQIDEMIVNPTGYNKKLINDAIKKLNK